MSITETSIIQPGTRVKVRRGRFPADPALLGRAGTVVLSSPYQPTRIGVTLDGDDRILTFAPSELERTDEPPALPPEQVAAMKRLARP